MAKSLLETPWAIAIDPARRDGRIVAESSEPERPAQPVAMPRSLDRGLVEALRAAGIERLYSHQKQALATAASSDLVVTSGTASGKSLAFNLPVLDGIARDPKRRALYLYPTKALAQDQARKLAALRPPGLREAIYDGDTPREERPSIRRRNNLVLTNPDMLHIGLLPNHKSWGDFLANLGWVVVDEAHTYRGVFGSHVANVLRRLRRGGAGPGGGGAAPGGGAALPPAPGDDRQPGRAGRGAGRRPLRADRRRRRAAGRPRDRDVEPAADRQGDRGAARAALRGGRAARGAGLTGGADDLLSQEQTRDRADPALRSRRPGATWQARAGRANRPLPWRLYPAAAARDRGPAEQRRAARGGRPRRARAGDRRRRARRGDLRHLPRHRRQPAPDVGPGRAPAPRARRLSRRPRCPPSARG